MPRMMAVASCSTVWFILWRPNESRLRFCILEAPIRLFVCVILIFAIFAVRLTVKHFVERHATGFGNAVGITELTQSGYRSLNEVVGVRRTLALGKHVADTHALENGTHGTARLDTGTGSRRTEQNQ